jgi:hypothetical protein
MPETLFMLAFPNTEAIFPIASSPKLLLSSLISTAFLMFAMTQISKRAMSTITEYDTGIPDIFDNIYDAETNPLGIISLALSENVSVP